MSEGSPNEGPTCYRAQQNDASVSYQRKHFTHSHHSVCYHTGRAEGWTHTLGERKKVNHSEKLETMVQRVSFTLRTILA